MWQHISILLGGVLAVAIGFVDAKTGHALTIGVDDGLILGGLAALGVKATGVLG